jgi:predicted phosphodiesterase
MRRIAAIGDVHGCVQEFEQLLRHLEWLSLDAIFHLGDLVDRGPDSGAVVAICRERGISGVLGNHEEAILKHHKRVSAGGELPQNPDKQRTLSQLTPEDFEYLERLPLVHVDEELNACLVHGGVWPEGELYNQPKNVVRCQMIKPGKVGDTRWWGKDAASHKSGKTEEQNRVDGYVRWYERYNHPQDTYYGHSVFTQPFIFQPEGAGRTIGIDTGSCFGGALTAAIIGDPTPWFVTVKSSKVWFENSYRTHQE